MNKTPKQFLTENMVDFTEDAGVTELKVISSMINYAEQEASKNLVKPDVSGRSKLLFAFIAEVKKEFADQNWDYLDFIAERVLKANNCT